MKKAYLPLVAFVLAVPLVAQESMPMSGSGPLATMGANLHYVQGFIVQAAKDVPEAEYAFKPTPEVRSFGQIVAHVADANYHICSTVLGKENPSPSVEKTKTAKADIVAGLEASYQYCDSAFTMSDQEMGGEVELFGQKMTRMAALLGDISHNWEHYGNIVTYMRMKGHVPPSSRPARM